MEIFIVIFIAVWMCTASVLAYLWLRKEKRDLERENVQAPQSKREDAQAQHPKCEAVESAQIGHDNTIPATQSAPVAPTTPRAPSTNPGDK